jgi:hypothetical protein
LNISNAPKHQDVVAFIWYARAHPIVGEPDLNSFMELTAPGFVDFRPTEEKNGQSFKYSPPEEDVRQGYWLVFGGAEGKDDNIAEHFKSHMKKIKR